MGKAGASDIPEIYGLLCPPLDRITFGQHESDNNNRMIQLADILCVLFRCNGTSSDYSEWLILSFVIQLSDGHCINIFLTEVGEEPV